MKKIIAILLTVIMAFGLAACNDGSSIEGADTKKKVLPAAVQTVNIP